MSSYIAGHCHRSYWDTVQSRGHLLQMLQGTLHITPSSTGEAHRARALLDPCRPDKTHIYTTQQTPVEIHNTTLLHDVAPNAKITLPSIS